LLMQRLESKKRIQRDKDKKKPVAPKKAGSFVPRAKVPTRARGVLCMADLRSRSEVKGDPDDEDGLSENQPSSGPSLSQSLLNPDQVYRFRLGDNFLVAASAGGTIDRAISCNPAGTPMVGWADLINLFGEVRLVRADLRVANYFVAVAGVATDINRTGMPIAYTNNYTATNPGSAGAVWETAGAKVLSMASPEVLTICANVGSRDFALTSSPIPAVFAGCYGQFWMYMNALTASAICLSVWLEVELEFRARF